MAKQKPDDTAVDMLLTRYTYTATGDPVPLAAAREQFGARIHPTARPGWFWTPATPTSAAHIRAGGHKAIGAELTTWIPPQTAVVALPVDEPTGAVRRQSAPQGASEPDVHIAFEVMEADHYSEPGHLDVMARLEDLDQPLIQIKNVPTLTAARAAFLEAWIALGVRTAMEMSTQPDVEF